MGTITRRRVLRPTTRQIDSPYRVKVEGIGPKDVLQLIISQEGDPKNTIAEYYFRGSDIGYKRSIYFKAEKIKGAWKLQFVGVKPSSTNIII